MNFNKLINSILKEEEQPSREDRIRAMDNLHHTIDYLKLGERVRIRDNYILPVSDGEIDIGGRVVRIVGHLPPTDEWFVVPEDCGWENWEAWKIPINAEDLTPI